MVMVTTPTPANSGFDQKSGPNHSSIAIPIERIRHHQVHSTPSFKFPRGNISNSVFLDSVLAILRKIPKKKCRRFTANF
jgi:hypothetical protein